MRFLISFLGNFLLPWVTACAGGQHDHSHASRQSRPVVAPPSAPLIWGDINILHTTDTHGWLGGRTHLTAPEPNYSGDLGMFSSFVTHMKEEAEIREVDLLLVDSGDLHDGNGLTDGFPKGDVNGHEVLKLFSKLPYDILAIGNHELYKYDVAYDIHKNFVPRWNGRYLTSNVNITLDAGGGRTTSVPIGDRFAKFRTQLGRQVTALGVLFDFTMNAENTTVQLVEDMVKENWFKEAISDEPDLFLLAGHMAVKNDKWPVVLNAIREVHPYTPVLIFGGHTHIRDCVQLDGRSMALESGRYMETIGWMSAKLGKHGGTDDIAFNRRYLDANPVSYSFHTGKEGEDFDTPQGLEITAGIRELSARFNLTYQFGIAPRDYFLERVPFPSDQSLLSLLMTDVLPTLFSTPHPRASIPRIFIVNSGIMRYDLYEGPFTRNDQYTVSPFTNTHEYISNVSWSVAEQLLAELNHSGPVTSHNPNDPRSQWLVNMGDVTAMYQLWLREQWERWNSEQRDESELTLGYVTQDSCPGVGDDVPHRPLPQYSLPTYVGSPLPPALHVSDAKAIDVVFPNFICKQVLTAVNTLYAGFQPNYTETDVKKYSDVLTDAVFGLYAWRMWR